jgi:8-oxo-dGTP pyrophosphatase MutT (NUDIX family)
VLRGAAADGSDEVVLGRLADDPAVTSPDGFIALLNAGLPTKRVIAHGVLRDPAGRVLLCELTYKPEWDLPGGVVEPGESPREGVVREVGEELGLAVVPLRLLTVNWLSPWRGWDDACVFVFDLGVHDPSLREQCALQPAEVAAVHWCDPETVARRGAAATGLLLDFLTTRPGGAPYLEGGVEPLG